MKILYVALFVISLFLAFVSIPPIPSEMSFSDRLRHSPDKWVLRFTPPDQNAFRVDPETGKAMLIEDLNIYRNSSDYRWAISGFVFAAALCAIGWTRENSFKKKKSQPSDALRNSSPSP